MFSSQRLKSAQKPFLRAKQQFQRNHIPLSHSISLTQQNLRHSRQISKSFDDLAINFSRSMAEVIIDQQISSPIKYQFYTIHNETITRNSWVNNYQPDSPLVAKIFQASNPNIQIMDINNHYMHVIKQTLTDHIRDNDMEKRAGNNEWCSSVVQESHVWKLISTLTKMENIYYPLLCKGHIIDTIQQRNLFDDGDDYQNDVIMDPKEYDEIRQANYVSAEEMAEIKQIKYWRLKMSGKSELEKKQFLEEGNYNLEIDNNGNLLQGQDQQSQPQIESTIGQQFLKAYMRDRNKDERNEPNPYTTLQPISRVITPLQLANKVTLSRPQILFSLFIQKWLQQIYEPPSINWAQLAEMKPDLKYRKPIYSEMRHKQQHQHQKQQDQEQQFEVHSNYVSQDMKNQFAQICSPIFNPSQYISKQQSNSYYHMLYFISYHHIRSGQLSKLQQRLLQLKQLQLFLNLNSLLPEHDFLYGDIFPSSFCYESMKPPRFIGPSGVLAQSSPIQKKKLFDIKHQIQDISDVDQILFLFSPTIQFKQTYAEYLNFYKLDSKSILNYRFQRRVGYVEWRSIQEEFIKNAQDGDANFQQLETNKYYKSFYASLVGYLPELQQICQSYHDYLWAYFKAVYYISLRQLYTKADEIVLAQSQMMDGQMMSNNDSQQNDGMYDSDGPEKYLHYSLVSFKDGRNIFDPKYDLENKMPNWFSLDVVKGLQALNNQVIQFGQANRTKNKRKYSSSPIYPSNSQKSCYKKLQQMLIIVFYRSVVQNLGVSVSVYEPIYDLMKDLVMTEKIKFHQMTGGGFNHFARMCCHLTIWMFVNHRLPNKCRDNHDRLIQMYVAELIERARYLQNDSQQIQQQQQQEEEEEQQLQEGFQEQKKGLSLCQSITLIIPLYFNFIINHSNFIKMYSMYLMLFIDEERAIKLQRKREIEAFLSEKLRQKLNDGLIRQIQVIVQKRCKGHDDMINKKRNKRLFMLAKQTEQLKLWDKISLQKLSWNDRPQIFIKIMAEMLQKKQYDACYLVFQNFGGIQDQIRKIARVQQIILINKLEIILAVMRLAQDWEMNEENKNFQELHSNAQVKVSQSVIFEGTQAKFVDDLQLDRINDQTRKLLVKIKELAFPKGLDSKILLSSEGVKDLESSLIFTYSLTKNILYEPLIKLQGDVLDYLIGLLCKILEGSDQLDQIGLWLKNDDGNFGDDQAAFEQYQDICQYKIRVKEKFGSYGIFVDDSGNYDEEVE